MISELTAIRFHRRQVLIFIPIIEKSGMANPAPKAGLARLEHELIRACLETPRRQILPNFRSMQGAFVKAYRGYVKQTERSRGRKGGERCPRVGFQTRPSKELLYGRGKRLQ
ncbi:hypothetical protein DQG23_05210 [Paenibacillus contaminans]|uniref:Uncharacterized protein n=1 Tax=Paenibacillus contaminans TaxID=450362 RepID=A0A329MSL0_9BACL|nr:hypothetical protein DQG23_05210 [Paenibacillus contaminans]